MRLIAFAILTIILININCILGRTMYFQCENHPNGIKSQHKQIVDQVHSDYIKHINANVVRSSPMKIDELMPLLDATKEQLLSDLDKQTRTARDCSKFGGYVKRRINWLETTLQGLLSSVFINFDVYGNEELEIVTQGYSGGGASKPFRSVVMGKLGELFAWSYHHFGKNIPAGSYLKRKIAFTIKFNAISFETSQQLHVETVRLFGQHLRELSQEFASLNPNTKSHIIGSLDSIISSCEATIRDIGKKYEEIPSDLLPAFRDRGHASSVARPLQQEYEKRIANCKELKAFVMEPTAAESMAYAVSDVNEYIRSAGRTNKYFAFLPNRSPLSFKGRDWNSLLDNISSNFQLEMADLRTPAHISEIYQNARGKLLADLAIVAGKTLSDDQRRRKEVYHWTVFLNTLNEFGQEAFVSKYPGY